MRSHLDFKSGGKVYSSDAADMQESTLGWLIFPSQMLRVRIGRRGAGPEFQHGGGPLRPQGAVPRECVHPSQSWPFVLY